jgi:hypothetical protein
MDRSSRAGRDWLSIAAVAFLAANLTHGADHIRQHMAGVDTAVKIGGAIITLGAFYAFRRRHHPKAPLIAIAIGLPSALLITQSHLLPHWSVLSDSYVNQIHADGLSWAVVILEVGTALWLALVGAVEMRAQARAVREPRTVRAAAQEV